MTEKLLEVFGSETKCTRCGRETHIAKACHAKYDIHQQEIFPAIVIPKKAKKGVEKKRKIIGPINRCYFYQRGNCTSSSCEFSHDIDRTSFNSSSVTRDRKKTVLCKFFRRGGCDLGTTCQYSHDLSKFPCVYFHKFKNCRNTNCEWMHGDLTTEMKEWLDLDQSFPRPAVREADWSCPAAFRKMKDKLLAGRKRHSFCQLLPTIVFSLITVYLVSLYVVPDDLFALKGKGAQRHKIRLPFHIKAEHYDLIIETDLVNLKFNGSVVATLNVVKKTRTVVLHEKLLNSKFNKLVDKNGKLYKLENRSKHADLEYVVYQFKQQLRPGTYQIFVDFDATLATNMAGYYVSSYQKDNSTHYLATTQFEPTDCRKAFPLLDEPEQKATFSIQMVVDSKYHAKSNMPVKEVKKIGNKDLYVFEKSVKMSSYLVAFVVSDFECIEAHTNNNVSVGVCTVPGRTNLGEYALKTGVKVLEYYQNVYGIDYPLPKLDMIAVPDFSAGAMENWGLVTYRDTALLYDPDLSTESSKTRVAEVIAHELAHQWFGNLVTMKWWSDLWLNEGFAEFMEYKAVNAVEPNWQMLDQFIPFDFVRALHADESRYTHKIAVNVENPNEISSIFDDISYGKGSSVLRMLDAWMEEKYGNGTFLNKLHGYLVEHNYGNADTQDLWSALSVGTEDIGSFMGGWLNQPGFPYLTFQLPTKDNVTVEQNRFIFSHLVHLDDKESRALKAAGQVWSVPVSYSVYSNKTGTPIRLTRGFMELNERGEKTIEFQGDYPEGSLVLANYLQTGVYRSLYNVKTYHYVLDWLKNDLNFLPNVERGGLISDIFSMTFSGLLKDPTISLEFLKLLGSDLDIFVWETALKDLETLKDIFALYPTYGPMVAFQTDLIKKIVKSVGWTETCTDCGNLHVRALLRARILGEAVRNGHQETVQTALKYYKFYKEGKRAEIKVSQDVFGAIYDAGVIYGDLSDYEFIQSQFLKSTFAPEQQLLLHALASSKLPYLQTRTLEFALSKQVRLQDKQGLIQMVATLSPVGHITTWIFLMDNWCKLMPFFEITGFSHFNDLLQKVIASFTKPYLINEAERLFIKRGDPYFHIPDGARTSVLKGLETCKQLLAWRSLYGAKVTQWLYEQGYE